MLKIVPAHWSTKEDSHCENDADVTYIIVDGNNNIIEIFTNEEEAEDFIKKT